MYHNRDDVCLHSLGSGSSMEQHLREEQQRRTVAERRVQLLEQKVTGKLYTLTTISRDNACSCASVHLMSYYGLSVCVQVCVLRGKVCVCSLCV